MSDVLCSLTKFVDNVSESSYQHNIENNISNKQSNKKHSNDHKFKQKKQNILFSNNSGNNFADLKIDNSNKNNQTNISQDHD